MSLREYVRKRDFQKTAEPRGAEHKKSKKAAPRFVIQKHDASHLHYDFRLEMDGTLKSWAVPKGVPYAKADKRLAMQVEDHPVDYAGFEGIIPKGQYGGGTVMVWDQGTYEGLGSDDPLKDLEEGKLHFALHGKKLEGEWTLVRMSRGKGNEWLLIKSTDDMKPLSKKKDDESAVSGRTMAQIARDQDAEWQSNRTEDEPKKKPVPKAKPAPKRKAVRRSKLAFIEPMKATLLESPPTHGDWSYELKFDGYRALALKSGDDVQLFSRNKKDFAARYPEIADAVREMPVDEAILDGEIVALDDEGRPSFQLLQGIDLGDDRPALAFYVFDLLRQDGADVTRKPLHERREQLAKLMKNAAEPIRYSATIEGDPERLLEEVRRRGLEGLIGKERDSLYEVGRRSRAWIKLKCLQEQEFVIGGYTPPEGSRKHLGAVIVGVFDKGKLKFAGKVGTGFNTAILKDVHRKLSALEQKECPFSDLPEKKGGRWSQNITPAEMRRCHWARPELVCQVKFTEWTSDGKLRHPVFLGLREDKQAKEVIHERAA